MSDTQNQPDSDENYVVQAYRRKEAFEEFVFGLRVQFKPNTKGHVVATIPQEREDVFKRFVDDIPEAYVEYEGDDNVVAQRLVEEQAMSSTTQAGAGVSKVPDPAKKFVIETSDDAGKPLVVDLAAMDDAGLKSFVKTSGIKGVPGNLKGDPLRAAIAKAVGQGAGPSVDDLNNQ